jgi:hypothetical protein
MTVRAAPRAAAAGSPQTKPSPAPRGASSIVPPLPVRLVRIACDPVIAYDAVRLVKGVMPRERHPIRADAPRVRSPARI